MSELILSGLKKSYGDVDVLRGLDLTVPEGKLSAILGPSGCGKTTLLRLVAGFASPDAGSIRLGDRELWRDGRGVAADRRGVGYVAQEGALFPHLTVAANITFGLQRSLRRDQRRINELLDLVGLQSEHAQRFPHQLSGGQQQRVALARSLAPQPGLVLLDEPFSALDAGLRVETRTAVMDALAASGTTTILVTHNQEEALSMADYVSVMRDGELVQTADPVELYTNPADADIARFLGDVVVLPAEVTGGVAVCSLGTVKLCCCRADGPAQLVIRPEQVRICALASGSGVRARVNACTFFGHDAVVCLTLDGAERTVSARCIGDTVPKVDEWVELAVVGDAMAYPA